MPTKLNIITLAFALFIALTSQPVLATGSNALNAKWTKTVLYGTANFAKCNLYTEEGVMVNDSKPIEDSVCDMFDPIIYAWGCSQIVEVDCYGYTSTGLIVAEGQPQYGKCSSPKPEKNLVCHH